MKKKAGLFDVGWREWCSLPDLGIPMIKAKVDTGARTSCLHAIHIKPFKKGKDDWVRFKTHPLQGDNRLTLSCEAKLIDQRHIKSSSGHVEHRYVIESELVFPEHSWDIHLTLSSRETMGIRMLLGREALRRKVKVNPAKSFLLGGPNEEELDLIYRRDS